MHMCPCSVRTTGSPSCKLVQNHLPDLTLMSHCLYTCLQCENYRESIMYDSNWEKAHFAFGRYLDQLLTDAKQREVRAGRRKQQLSENGAGPTHASWQQEALRGGPCY
jgi:hypothetical protein